MESTIGGVQMERLQCLDDPDVEAATDAILRSHRPDVPLESAHEEAAALGNSPAASPAVDGSLQLLGLTPEQAKVPPPPGGRDAHLSLFQPEAQIALMCVHIRILAEGPQILLKCLDAVRLQSSSETQDDIPALPA